MAAPELPVIYENPRFDSATPTLKPVIDRAIRAGLALMLEWGTLTIIESAPAYLKWATVVIAILGLSVHESWPWLRLRDKRLYPALMGGLAAIYVAVFAYGLVTVRVPVPANTEPNQSNRPVPSRRLTDAGVDWNGGVGPITFRGRFTKTGEKVDVFLEWGMMLGQPPVVGNHINWDGRRIPLKFDGKAVRNTEMKVVVGNVLQENGSQLVLQLGDDPQLKVGINNSAYALRVILVGETGAEESYLFAMIPSSSQASPKPLPAVIVDPGVFLGRGNM